MPAWEPRENYHPVSPLPELSALMDENDDVGAAVTQVIENAPGVAGNLLSCTSLNSGTTRPAFN